MASTLPQEKASRLQLILLMQEASRMMTLMNSISQMSKAIASLLMETEWNGYNNIEED